MKSWKRLAATGVVAAGVPAAMMLVGVLACGPDFEPEVFVTAHHPNTPKLYADGHLGVLQRGYFHAELVIAYRYLSGGRLSDAEKRSYIPPLGTAYYADTWQPQSDAPQAELPTRRWLAARAAVQTPVPDSLLQQYKVTDTQRQGYVERDERLNCPDAAFNTAIDTLMRRTKTWGANSEELKEWARGQDAVFSNCEKAGVTPDAAKPGWSTLLKQDRAYQIAAAEFYWEDFDSARDDFVAIGKDKTSPWSRWGEYLAARADVRKASVAGKVANVGDAAHFDKDLLLAAQTRLLKLQKETSDAEIRHAADAELGFVDVRLVPEKRLDQVSTALAGPKPDPEFQQDLIDLDFLMDRRVVGDSDLALWIQWMQDATPAHPSNDPQFLLHQWSAKHSLPWMIAAFARTPKDASSDLMDAAAKVKPDSPGFETVNYYRADRLLSAGKTAEARALLNTLLAGLGPETMPSTRNQFLSQRMLTARSLDEFLADAPRTLIQSNSSAAEMAQCADGRSGTGAGCTGKIPPLQFDADASGYMNTQMPLAMLEQAATSSVLPQHLRQSVAEAAWVRALGLGNKAAVRRMSRLLPELLRQAAGESDGFPATLALLRSPGLRPYLEQGVQRSASFGDLDHFRDNWWCDRWTDGSNQPATQSSQVIQAEPLSFLSAQQRQQTADEATRLNSLPAGLVWTAQRAIAYVKTHPSDKDSPETLALIVHGTRYGCDYNFGPQPTLSPQRAVSKEAFEMLHRMYPKSEWAMKTKYYY